MPHPLTTETNDGRMMNLLVKILNGSVDGGRERGSPRKPRFDYDPA